MIPVVKKWWKRDASEAFVWFGLNWKQWSWWWKLLTKTLPPSHVSSVYLFLPFHNFFFLLPCQFLCPFLGSVKTIKYIYRERELWDGGHFLISYHISCLLSLALPGIHAMPPLKGAILYENAQLKYWGTQKNSNTYLVKIILKADGAWAIRIWQQNYATKYLWPVQPHANTYTLPTQIMPSNTSKVLQTWMWVN